MCFENCIEFPWYVVQRQGIKSARSILNYYNVKSNSYVHALVLVGHFVLLEESLAVPERFLAPCSSRLGAGRMPQKYILPDCHLDCGITKHFGEG